MKNYTKILAVLIALVGLFSLQSCNMDQTPVSTDALYTTSTVAYDLFEANNVGVISPSALNVNDDIMALEVRPEKTPNPYGPYGYALSRLNLTDEQKTAITAEAQAFIDCITAATQTVRDAEKAIMDQLKADVTAIMEQVKAGSLDKAAAREQVKALQTAAKAAVEAIPGRAEALAAAKDCFTKYDAAVRALLTEEQIKALDTALANKGKGNGKDGGKGNGKDGGKGTGKGKSTLVTGPLGKVLTQLTLDSLQIVGANDAAKVYKDCYQLAWAAVREQEKVIFDALKTQRDAIFAELKAGTIDRATAQTRLSEAEAAAKTAAANIPGRAEAEAAAKKCYDSYVATIKGLLRPDQLTKLEEIIAAGGGATGPTKP